ncbi:MAG TPA: SRPBCC family protein [Usitatibacteraceae bacterium]|nr:SRPBCC family protein [Usitatibacteraceae bacterium]
MLKTIAIIVGLAVVVILAAAANKPDTFRVQRSASIKAPPEKIFPLLTDFRNWAAWSPWEKRDPALRRTYAGPASGTGASYAWEGNKDVGSGRMEIAEAAPPSEVRIKIDFAQPFEAHNIVEFRLTPEGEATRIAWAMHGPQTFPGKLMSVFFSIDNMIGRDFEAGLASLKSVAEN